MENQGLYIVVVVLFMLANAACFILGFINAALDMRASRCEGEPVFKYYWLDTTVYKAFAGLATLLVAGCLLTLAALHGDLDQIEAMFFDLEGLSGVVFSWQIWLAGMCMLATPFACYYSARLGQSCKEARDAKQFAALQAARRSPRAAA